MAVVEEEVAAVVEVVVAAEAVAVVEEVVVAVEVEVELAPHLQRTRRRRCRVRSGRRGRHH